MIFRILVTNDDGINAPGLKVAEEFANVIAGLDGEVVTVAPAVDQSGVAHSISYLRPALIHKHTKSRYSIEGSPADCILAGVYHVMKDAPPDLIISGVNKGHNLSDDIVYSGTIGAAMEGALQGIKSIAISQCYSRESLLFDDIFEASRALGTAVCKRLYKLGNWKSDPYQTFYNINFPAVKVCDVAGIKVCKQGKRPQGSFSMDPIQSPNGQTFLMVNHKPNIPQTTGPKENKSDSELVRDNYITVTPLKADLTAQTELEDLKNIFKNGF